VRFGYLCSCISGSGSEMVATASQADQSCGGKMLRPIHSSARQLCISCGKRRSLVNPDAVTNATLRASPGAPAWQALDGHRSLLQVPADPVKRCLRTSLTISSTKRALFI